MKIICSTNIPYAEEAFRPLGDLTILAPKEITADRVRNADVLVIRSTLRANRALLEGSRVRFVGTATIGTDHLDQAYLDQAGITWCAAPGYPKPSTGTTMFSQWAFAAVKVRV